MSTIVQQFQSALPRGERHDFRSISVTEIYISIRAPARGATPTRKEALTALAISIRAPARGATRGDRRTGATGGNFNPRSREGSDVNRICHHVRM